MNKVILMGRLTAAPEIRQTQSGTAFCNFTLAVDRPKSKTDERETDFIRCVAFGKTAEIISKYVAKGNQLLVDGNIKTGSYQDKTHADITHYTTDVWVEKIDLIGSKNTTEQKVSKPKKPPF